MSELAQEEELEIVEDDAAEEDVVVDDTSLEDGEESTDEDVRLGGDEDDEDIRSRRREERKERKQRQKDARERTERELKFLRKRNEDLEQWRSSVDAKLNASDISQIDQRIAHAKSQIKAADEVIANAVENGNGKDMIEAQSIRDDLRDSIVKLSYYKQNASQPKPAADPTIANMANGWHSKNSWWDPNGKDADSAKIREIDDEIAKEGYDPRSTEYWDELTKRASAAIPHRFRNESQKNTQETRQDAPRMRVGGTEKSLKPNQVYISADRKQALIEAGVWDDPEQRKRYLKQYAEYDRAARSGA